MQDATKVAKQLDKVNEGAAGAGDVNKKIEDVTGCAANQGKAAAESTAASKESVLRDLRQNGSPESLATASLIKREKIKPKFKSTDPHKKGAAGRKPWGDDVVEVYTDKASDAFRAAGVIVHESKHWLQRISPSTYRRIHEFEAYCFQRAAGYLNMTDDEIWDLIRNNDLYKGTPE